MALHLMRILLIFLIIMAVAGIVLLFAVRGPRSGPVVGLLVGIYALLTSYMAFTAPPSNYLLLKIPAILWAILAVVGIVFRLLPDQNHRQLLGKVLISAALVFSAFGVFGYGIF